MGGESRLSHRGAHPVLDRSVERASHFVVVTKDMRLVVVQSRKRPFEHDRRPLVKLAAMSEQLRLVCRVAKKRVSEGVLRRCRQVTHDAGAIEFVELILYRLRRRLQERREHVQRRRTVEHGEGLDQPPLRRKGVETSDQ